MILNIIQQDTSVVVDTLTKAFSQKWQAASEMSSSNAIIQAMGSHNLIFIVLGVTLIIWFVLLFFIIRLDKKVGVLEKQQESLKQTNEMERHEA